MRRAAAVLTLAALVYVGGYLFLRQSLSETWSQDGRTYVIYPEDRALYYGFRPLAVLDSTMTGI